MLLHFLPACLPSSFCHVTKKVDSEKIKAAMKMNLKRRQKEMACLGEAFLKLGDKRVVLVVPSPVCARMLA